MTENLNLVTAIIGFLSAYIALRVTKKKDKVNEDYRTIRIGLTIVISYFVIMILLALTPLGLLTLISNNNQKKENQILTDYKEGFSLDNNNPLLYALRHIKNHELKDEYSELLFDHYLDNGDYENALNIISLDYINSSKKTYIESLYNQALLENKLNVAVTAALLSDAQLDSDLMLSSLIKRSINNVNEED